MKRLLIICLLFAVSAAAQNGGKGRISLTFNGEKIDLPISTVLMRKEKTVRISARAENNNEEIQQIISLDLTLDKLSLDNGDPIKAENFLMKVNTNKKIRYANGTVVDSGKSFWVSLSDENPASQFSIYFGSEKLDWRMLALQIHMEIKKIDLVNAQLKITGEFKVILRSKLEEYYGKEVAKIENGKFEIII